jgi:hypothetical protein
MDPATLTVLASIISSGAKAGQGFMAGRREKKLSKKRSKEMKRETFADLLDSAFQRDAQNEAQRLESRSRLGKRKGQSFEETANLVREAFNI